MNSVTLPGATALVTNNLSRFLARLDRPALEAVAQAAIDQHDTLDGDAGLGDRDDDIASTVVPLPRLRLDGTLRLHMGGRS